MIATSKEKHGLPSLKTYTAEAPTIAELILDEHVVVLCPGGVVTDKMRVGSQHSMSVHLPQCGRPYDKQTQRHTMEKTDIKL